MYTTLDDFHADIEKARLLLSMTALLKEFSGLNEAINYISSKDNLLSLQEAHIASFNHNNSNNEAYINPSITDIVSKIDKLHDSAKKNHSNLVVLNGTLLLFIAGRFESFIRETFEEFCKNIVIQANKFNHLPREMRENLVKYTSDVISNPRKYGHSENGVKSFVRILYKNLSDEENLTEINHQCISVTHENMRPEILSDLFKRVGVKNIWDKISQQSQLQVFFETGDASYTRNQSEIFLNTLMDRRNSIAHPSRSITWPDIDYITKSLDFFKTLSSVIINSLNAIEFDMKDRIKNTETSPKK